MALLKLYFKNSQGKERLIAERKTVKEIHKAISKFLEEHNYTSYYSRSFSKDGRIKIDVGSYTEFFFIDGITHDEYIAALCREDDNEEYHQITMDEYLESLQNS